MAEKTEVWLVWIYPAGERAGDPESAWSSKELAERRVAFLRENSGAVGIYGYEVSIEPLSWEPSE